MVRQIEEASPLGVKPQWVAFLFSLRGRGLRKGFGSFGHFAEVQTAAEKYGRKRRDSVAFSDGVAYNKKTNRCYHEGVAYVFRSGLRRGLPGMSIQRKERVRKEWREEEEKEKRGDLSLLS